jgi:hypothetical protein
MPHFTIQADSFIDKAIATQLDLIVQALDDNSISYESIYLIGSFGRGEGAVTQRSGQWLALNDYDIQLITETPSIEAKKHLAKIGLQLASDLGVDFVDFAALPSSSLESLPLTIQNFDFKYGSKLICGEDKRHLIPDYNAGDIPPFELVRLICNRAAGLLLAELPAYRGNVSMQENQIIKAWIAIADMAIYLKRDYHTSYKKRMEIFQQMYLAGDLPFSLNDEEYSQLYLSFEKKLNGPDSCKDPMTDEYLRPVMMRAIKAFTSDQTRQPTSTLAMAEKSLRSLYEPRIFNARNIRSNIRKLIRILTDSQHRKDILIPKAKYRTLLATPFFYCRQSAGLGGSKWFYLSHFWWVPGALVKKWNKIGAVHLWKDYNH